MTTHNNNNNDDDSCRSRRGHSSSSSSGSADDAAAYRVAQLLRDGSTGGRTHTCRHDASSSSLQSLMRQVGSFLATAPQVPPIVMETTTVAMTSASGDGARDCDDETADDDDGQRAPCVELSVVAGVLEQKAPVGDVWPSCKRTTDNNNNKNARSSHTRTLLLPTERTRRELQRARVREATAFVQLADALASGDSAPVHAVHSTSNDNDSSDSDDSSDDDDDIVVMDAAELTSDTSSDDNDDDACATRRTRARIVELT